MLEKQVYFNGQKKRVKEWVRVKERDKRRKKKTLTMAVSKRKYSGQWRVECW